MKNLKVNEGYWHNLAATTREFIRSTLFEISLCLLNWLEKLRTNASLIQIQTICKAWQDVQMSYSKLLSRSTLDNITKDNYLI